MTVVVVVVVITDYRVAATVFSLFGKGFISVTLAVVYLFASEIFPTEVRQVGMGTASMLARISGMAAPYVGGPLVGTLYYLVKLSKACIEIEIIKLKKN